MIIVKITNKIKIQKYSIKGLKLFLKHKDKWFCIKLNNKELERLDFIIKSIID